MQILLSASEVFACSILYGKGDENYETVKKVIVDYDVRSEERRVGKECL